MLARLSPVTEWPSGTAPTLSSCCSATPEARTRRPRYAYHEEQEQITRDYLGADVSVLSHKVKGVTTPLTLRAFREQLEAGTAQFDLFDIGGCGCFTDEAPPDEDDEPEANSA